MHSITQAQALALVKQFWHIEGEAKELPSYADRNFKISTATRSYVFKIANPNWSHADLDMENAALLLLEKTCPELALPKVIIADSGAHIIALTIANGQTCHMRLLSFVDGDVYAKQAQRWSENAAQDQTALPASLGRALALLQRGLSNFVHPAMHRNVDWSISNLPTLMDEIIQIESPALREIVQRHSRYFTAHEPTWKVSLPMSVIHNDANDFNIIVGHTLYGAAPQVTAIIDFGDMCRHFRVLDLAIAMTYALQHTCTEEGDSEKINENIVACAMAILNAYQSIQALTQTELDALFHLLMARLCQSILMANKAYRASPDNDYIMISQVGVRRLISRLDAMPYEQLQSRFLNEISPTL